MIRKVNPQDASDLCAIYNPYVQNTIVTFEETPVSEDQMRDRIRAQGNQFPWLVFEEQKSVLAYAYASSWKERSAYRFTVETTVYVHPDARGRGCGSALYHTLLPTLQAQGFHRAVACLALPNEDSQRLHEKFGFKQVATFSEVGFKFGRWLAIGYWELSLGEIAGL
ncbi:MAG: N-acetyltransferase [Spirochaetales bacterium]|nr:N-acetyltransferase [Spirochaetales bacterium]